MARYIAFLRAINVGGHTVKMAHLRTLFEALGLDNVETFIASGNVIFETPSQDVGGLEHQIAAHLHESLGYAVETFIRSTIDLAVIAARQPFGEVTLARGGNTLYVAFLKAPPSPEACARLLAFQSDVDHFVVAGREVYWLCRKDVGLSTFSGGRLENALAAPATLRNVNTVVRLVKKYPAA